MSRKMILGDPPAIRLTDNDLGRLDALLSGSSSKPRLEFLRREVDRAVVVAEAEAASFVKLGSLMSFEDEAGRLYTGTIGFPRDVAGHLNPISILTPVGVALLGLAEGESISYETLDARIKTLTVIRLLPPT